MLNNCTYGSLRYHDYPEIVLGLEEKLPVLLCVQGFSRFCRTEGSGGQKEVTLRGTETHPNRRSDTPFMQFVKLSHAINIKTISKPKANVTKMSNG